MKCLCIYIVIIAVTITVNALAPPRFRPVPPVVKRIRPIRPRTRNIPIPVRRMFVENDANARDNPRRSLNPNTKKNCQITGCPTGQECVLPDRWICPTWIPSLPCQCRPGCRHRNIFLRPGETKRIDNCGSTCSCLSMLGTVNCDHKNC